MTTPRICHVSDWWALQAAFDGADLHEPTFAIASIVTNRVGLFDDSGLSAIHYDRALIGWAGRDLSADVSLGG